MDIFLEQRVQRRVSGRDWGVRTATAAAAAVVAVAVAAVSGSLLLTLVIAVIGLVGLRMIVKRQRREYEYIFTNGALDIDVIYNREWRRRLYTLDLRQDVQQLARASDPAHNQCLSTCARVHHVGRGGLGENSWILQARDGQGDLVLVWEPSDEMIKACRQIAPRLVAT